MRERARCVHMHARTSCRITALDGTFVPVSIRTESESFADVSLSNRRAVPRLQSSHCKIFPDQNQNPILSHLSGELPGSTQSTFIQLSQATTSPPPPISRRAQIPPYDPMCLSWPAAQKHLQPSALCDVRTESGTRFQTNVGSTERIVTSFACL